MRTVRHWSPKYIKDRIQLYFFEKANPNTPWLTPEAINCLDAYLKPSDVGLEYGSGRSTVWFAKRLKHLISVEHDGVWAEFVREKLSKEHVNNVDYQIVPQNGLSEEEHKQAYVKVAETLEPESLDFCLVDGQYRGPCVQAVLDKLRPGGLLVIDNVNWYLPSDTSSPASRSLAEGPSNAMWQEIAETLSTWRRIWTSSGVSDTALFFKPLPS